jgi:hypothetical protein
LRVDPIGAGRNSAMALQGRRMVAAARCALGATQEREPDPTEAEFGVGGGAPLQLIDQPANRTSECGASGTVALTFADGAPFAGE